VRGGLLNVYDVAKGIWMISGAPGDARSICGGEKVGHDSQRERECSCEDAVP